MVSLDNKTGGSRQILVIFSSFFPLFAERGQDPLESMELSVFTRLTGTQISSRTPGNRSVPIGHRTCHWNSHETCSCSQGLLSCSQRGQFTGNEDRLYKWSTAYLLIVQLIDPTTYIPIRIVYYYLYIALYVNIYIYITIYIYMTIQYTLITIYINYNIYIYITDYT